MANFAATDSIRWNIFARELEDVLGAHGLRLGHLDDREIVLHREKVRRLQQSLKRPTSFPTLNPEEMERLFAAVPLSHAEQDRLRAALLATAIERILMDRIDRYAALMGANDAFAIILEAMQSAKLAGVKVGMITGDEADDEADADGDEAFQSALEQIDRATLALHNALQATTDAARIASAHEAYSAFSAALSHLEQTRRPSPTSDQWRSWQGEARKGREQAEAVLGAAQSEE